MENGYAYHILISFLELKSKYLEPLSLMWPIDESILSIDKNTSHFHTPPTQAGNKTQAKTNFPVFSTENLSAITFPLLMVKF